MEYFVEHYSYVAVVVLLMLGGFGVPLPEDMPLILGGYFCYLYPEHLDIEVMVPVCFAAVMMGDLIMYTLGRVCGDRVKKMRFFRRYLTPERLEKAQFKFHEHGGKALFTARFLPGLRTATFFSAGVFKIPAWKMLAFDGAAALLSVPLLVMLPWYFGEYISLVKELLKEAQTALLATLVICVLVFVAIKLRKYRLAKAAAKAPAHKSMHTPGPPAPSQTTSDQS
jgi:membrane protein DedA with SNARE-associated domain